MGQKQGEKVALLGATDKKDRYAYLAFHLLKEHGHQPFPVHPTLKSLEGQKVFARLAELPKPVDTLTVYVNPSLSSQLSAEILALKPGRVIFNPGTENPELQKKLDEVGIPWEEACTLVLLRTGQY